jgi:hypothetical protein
MTLSEEKDTAARINLIAQNAEDLTVLSAVLQDAVLKVGDMAYRPRQNRFAAVFNRYRWEAEGRSRRRRGSGSDSGQRVRCGVHFNGVLGVRRQGFDQNDPERVLELLAIACEPGEEGAAELTLVFAGDAAVRLDVECIDAQLSDLSGPWQARGRPEHKLDDV